MAKKISHTLLNIILIIFLFLMLSGIFAYFLIEYLFPQATLNQIIFHLAFIDKSAVYAYKWPILITLTAILSSVYLIRRWPIVFIPMCIVAIYHIYFNIPPVSYAAGDKEISAFHQLHISFQHSRIYEDFYFVPNIVNKAPKKNVIVIFAESFEKNFADETYWGENLIPNLSELAKQHTTFSGYKSVNGTNWSIASNASVFCGIPLRMQFRNALGIATPTFFPNAVCLSDLLHEAGYHNVFLKGAYLDFAGTNTLLNEHHFDETFGRDELLEMQFATEDDLSMNRFISRFGVNDTKTFEFAKLKLTELSKRNQPFFMSVETQDTHFPSGYVHPTCPVKYRDTRDAVKCSDKIIYDFIKWCQQQDFYKNTIIVLFGDHLMMNTSDIAELLINQPHREIYNVIISADDTPRTIQKTYAQFDWGATILDMLQIIDQPRLGIGYSILRDEPTLVERLGIEKLEDELLKNSHYYKKLIKKKK